MFKTGIVAASILGGVVKASPALSSSSWLAPRTVSFDPSTNSSGIPPCDALKSAGLGDRLLFATDPGYEPQIQTWFAANSRLRPYCLILPENTQEVSTALTALVNTNDGAGDWHIAVRSGGHSVFASSIANGVTIDLSYMNSSSYDAQANVAKVEPGGRWKNVYADLLKYNVTVTGGRDGDVGVGGFLTGGGNSYFSGRMGFGCDTIVNYEVVLANGTIVNANRTANADLWKALKGGSSNFGIVTRFDMEPIPARDLYYDTRFLSYDHSDTVIDAVVGFTNQNQSLADNALVTFYVTNASTSDGITIGTINVNTQGDGNVKTAFDAVKALPALTNSTEQKSMAAAALGSQVTSGTNNGGATLTFRNDPEIVRGVVKLFENYVNSLKGSIDPTKFLAGIFLQPIPTYMAKVSDSKGGNMLGLDNVNENAILWSSGVAVDVDQDESVLALALAETAVLTAQMKDYVKSMQGEVDFVYLNYADASQDPLGSYGSENVQFIRDVAAAYDPTGVFQQRIPGGFKISRVA
ncbi:hypothetical protein M426DRAFT_16758 [Hypoxylon sp. CI-4A]|nr:hypothetical protein M426DRAFT_16758 [Hypoxylon sp. CI-4A]